MVQTKNSKVTLLFYFYSVFKIHFKILSSFSNTFSWNSSSLINHQNSFIFNSIIFISHKSSLSNPFSFKPPHHHVFKPPSKELVRETKGQEINYITSQPRPIPKKPRSNMQAIKNSSDTRVTKKASKHFSSNQAIYSIFPKVNHLLPEKSMKLYS